LSRVGPLMMMTMMMMMMMMMMMGPNLINVKKLVSLKHGVRAINQT